MACHCLVHVADVEDDTDITESYKIFLSRRAIPSRLSRQHRETKTNVHTVDRLVYVIESFMSYIRTLALTSADFTDLVRSLGPGDEIVVTEGGQPIARIVASPRPAKRVAGTCKELLTIVSDDDEHLEDFKDYTP